MKPYDIFISYARNELDWVEEHLYRPLLDTRKSNGQKPSIFLDRDEIPTGANFNNTLEEALKNSSFIVPIYSPTYFSKEWTQRELETASVNFKERLRPIAIAADAVIRKLIYDKAIFLTTVNFVNAASDGQWFGKFCADLGFSKVQERLILEFLDQPADTKVNFSLPPVRVKVNSSLGSLSHEEEVRISLRHEGGKELDCLEGPTQKESRGGIASFDNLLISAPVVRARLMASIPGSEPITSKPFSVTSQSEARTEEGVLIPSRGTVVFFEEASNFAVAGDESLAIYTRSGKCLGTVPLGRNVKDRVVGNSVMAFADWEGNVTLVYADGRHATWPFLQHADSLMVPGGLAIQEEDAYVGFWSGTVFRLSWGAPAAGLFNVDGGVQRLAVTNRRIYVATLEGELTGSSPRGDSIIKYTVEPVTHLLKATRDGVIVLGDSHLYKFDEHSSRLFKQKAPFENITYVCGRPERPIIVNRAGRGVIFDEDLNYRISFHTAAGTVPESADQRAELCILRNPEGKRLLLRLGRISFTYGGGSVTVSPKGDFFAVETAAGIRLLDSAAFERFIARNPT